jgi:hypothetical protein
MDINKKIAQAYLQMQEGWKKGKVKKEAWVPESIADEDVADFMGAAAAAAKAGKKEFKFGDKTYKVTMKKSTAKAIEDAVEICEKCGKVHEGSCNESVKEEIEELDEASIQMVAKDLEAYAKKSGGIDKKDFMKAADMMKSNQKAALVKFVDELDTEPRDKIISMVAQMLGRKTAEKMFSVKIRESVEDLEENNSDKYMWKDINAALMKAGMNPPQIMKVLSGLKGKAIKEEALEESPEQPRAKGEKDFKKMHDDNVEINDEEKNDEENFKNIKKSADAVKK